MNWLQAILLGTVEGLTEFLPISSTGHLMVAGQLLGLDVQSDAFIGSFNIAIQLGAILAVVVLYWRSFLVEWEVFKRVIAAFIPTAIGGLLLYKVVKEHLLTNPALALWTLGLGGVALILFERFHGESNDATDNLNSITYRQAVVVGCCQLLAMVPGVSRAGATVVGGMAVAVGRRTIVEFSFLLAVPTMAAATAMDLYKSAAAFSVSQFGLLALGFVVSFLVAILAIQFLLRFFKTHTLLPFGVYRILAAVVIGLLVLSNVISLSRPADATGNTADTASVQPGRTESPQ